MEVKKKWFYSIIIFFICLLAMGCEKKCWWDYEYAWVSTEPYIYVSTANMSNIYYSELEIDGKIIVAYTSWYNDGSGIEFYIPLASEGDGFTEEEIIWDTSVEIIDDIMYLTVEVDNYGNNEGRTFILEQAENESAE